MPFVLPLLVLLPATVAGSAVLFSEREQAKAKGEPIEIVRIDAGPLMLSFRDTYEQLTALWENAPEILAQREAELASDKAALAGMDASDPNYSAAQFNVGVSEDNLAAAEVLRENAGQARADIGWTLIGIVGRVITEVKNRRARIDIGEQGLVGFDNDLAQISARYKYLYRRFFEELAGETPDGYATAPTPDATGWDEDDFAVLEERIINPILYWSLVECRDNWPDDLEGVPPCEGPDMLTAWSLTNQVSAGERHQNELIRNVFGWMHIRLEHFAEEFSADVKAVFEVIAEHAKKVWEEVKQIVKEVFPAKYIVGGLVVVGVAWALGRKR